MSAPSRTVLILIGMKSSGKTRAGQALAKKLGLEFADLDRELEKMHFQEKGKRLGFRQIFEAYGKDYFRALETATLRSLVRPSTTAGRAEAGLVLATGGGTPLEAENQSLLRELGTVIFLDVDEQVLLPRIIAGGIPAFFPYPNDPARSLSELLEARRPIYKETAHLTLQIGMESPELVADKIMIRVHLWNREDHPHPNPLPTRERK